MSARSLINSNKLVGHGMFLVYFALAIVFYLERTLFVDPCYAVFNILYYHDYVTEAGRHAAVFPQTLALLAMKMNLPLRVILLSYSISFILLYYLVFLVIVYIFKLDWLALAVPLLFVLGIKYSFFWISTETQQALVYTILFYAFLIWSMKFRQTFIVWIFRVFAASGILLLCFYSHPVSLFTVLFVLGFYMVENNRWLKPEGYILGSVIVTLAVVKFLNGSSVGYESFYYKGFGEFFTRLGDLMHSESLQFLKINLLNIYFFPLVIFAVTVWWYLKLKQYFKLGYYLVSVVLFSLVVLDMFSIINSELI